MWEHDHLLPPAQRMTTRSISKRTTDCLKALLKLYVVPGPPKPEDPRQLKISEWLTRTAEDDGKGEVDCGAVPPAGAAPPGADKKEDEAAAIADGLELVKQLAHSSAPQLEDFDALVREHCGSDTLTPEQLTMLYEKGDDGADIVQRMISAVIASDIASFEKRESSLPLGKWVYVADNIVSDPFDSRGEAFTASLRFDTPMRHPFGVQVIRMVGSTSGGSRIPPLLTPELSSATHSLVRAAHILQRAGETTDCFPDPPDVPAFSTPVLWANNRVFPTNVIYDTGASASVYFNLAGVKALRGLVLSEANARKPLQDGVEVVMHNPLISDCTCAPKECPEHWQTLPAGAGGTGDYNSLVHRYLWRGMSHPILVMGAKLLQNFSLSMWFGPDRVHRFVDERDGADITRFLCRPRGVACTSVDAVPTSTGCSHAFSPVSSGRSDASATDTASHAASHASGSGEYKTQHSESFTLAYHHSWPLLRWFIDGGRLEFVPVSKCLRSQRPACQYSEGCPVTVTLS